MTSWELEAEIRKRLEKAKDEHEREFLTDCLSEVLLLRSLRHRLFYAIDLFGDHVIRMRELVRKSPETGTLYDAIWKYLDKNK